MNVLVMLACRCLACDSPWMASQEAVARTDGRCPFCGSHDTESREA